MLILRSQPQIQPKNAYIRDNFRQGLLLSANPASGYAPEYSNLNSPTNRKLIGIIKPTRWGAQGLGYLNQAADADPILFQSDAFATDFGVQFRANSSWTFQCLIVNVGKNASANPGFWRSDATRQGPTFILNSGANNRARVRVNGVDILNPSSGPTWADGDTLNLIVRFKNASYVDQWFRGDQQYAASHSTSQSAESIYALGDNFGTERVTGLWTYARFWERFLDDGETELLANRPHDFYAPSPRRIWVPGAAPSGLTVNAGIGAATAAGSQATISLGRTALAGIGAATAAGLTAGISLGRTVAAGIGAASANGLQAGISLGRTVGAGVGAATADGLQATIETGSGTIIAGVGAATATGLTAGISLGLTVGAGIGAAEARGLQATISTQIIVPTTGFGDLSFWHVPRRKTEVREKAAEVVAAVREELPGPIPRPVKVAQARLNRLLAEAPPILAGQQAIKIRAQLDVLATAAETARRARAARRKAQQIRLLLED